MAVQAIAARWRTSEAWTAPSTIAPPARAFVADGVTVVACTLHILPGGYQNSGPGIRRAATALQTELDRSEIDLRLVTGADVHIAPRWVEGLRRGELLSIADSRYVLVEWPRHVAPPRFVFGLNGVPRW